jgi:pilus assembly protein Flp/PilA
VLHALVSLLTDEEGQTMAEYGLILALIAVAVIGALTALGPQISSIFDSVGSELSGS